MRIVVAEDQPAEAANLARLLAGLGHEVTLASSGPAALSACLGSRPDGAFIDLLLPGLDGFAVVRELRAADPENMPWLVAITAIRSSAAEEVARASGFRAVLHKPYDNEDIRALLGRLTAGGQAVAD